MADVREVVVLSGVRTPVGNYGGSVEDFSPVALGAILIQEAVGRAGVAPNDVGHVVFGNVIPTEEHDVDWTPDQRDRLRSDREGVL
jgi:acetyl-CoA C-acetyltransferase